MSVSVWLCVCVCVCVYVSVFVCDQPLKPGERRINKSRYDSIDCYISLQDELKVGAPLAPVCVCVCACVCVCVCVCVC
ncbi:MAG TPA: hypothetical protein V6C97_24440 [Oculatellaceae cyanobacterium]